jgi:hypothetical protein
MKINKGIDNIITGENEDLNHIWKIYHNICTAH